MIGEPSGRRRLAGLPAGVEGEVLALVDELHHAAEIRGIHPAGDDGLPLREDAPLRTELFPYRGQAAATSEQLHDYEKILVERAYRELPATWDASTEDKIFALLFDLFRNKLHHATELPAIKPTVAAARRKSSAKSTSIFAAASYGIGFKCS